MFKTNIDSDEFNNLSKKIDDLEREIEKKNEEYRKLNSKLEKIGDTIYKLESKKEEVENQINSHLLQERFFEIDEGNTLFYRINKTTKTVDLLDRYEKSGKLFLVLTRAYAHLYARSRHVVEVGCYDTRRHLSLVILPSHFLLEDNKHICISRNCSTYSSPTMTEIKMSCGRIIRHYTNYPTRMEELINTVKKAFEYDEELKTLERKTYWLDCPISIGGQTSENRTGYGNEYRYGELLWEGTNYGETTRFYVVGFIIETL